MGGGEFGGKEEVEEEETEEEEEKTLIDERGSSLHLTVNHSYYFQADSTLRQGSPICITFLLPAFNSSNSSIDK